MQSKQVPGPGRWQSSAVCCGGLRVHLHTDLLAFAVSGVAVRMWFARDPSMNRWVAALMSGTAVTLAVLYGALIGGGRNAALHSPPT